MSEKITQQELAHRLGLTTRQVRNLEEKGLPTKVARDGKKSWLWPEAMHWYIDFKAQTIAPLRDDSEDAKLERRERMAKVRSAEVSALRAEGQLMPTKLHAERYNALATEMAGIIRSLPQYGPSLLGITDHIEMQLACEKVANHMLSLARNEPPMDEVEVAALAA